MTEQETTGEPGAMRSAIKRWMATAIDAQMTASGYRDALQRAEAQRDEALARVADRDVELASIRRHLGGHPDSHKQLLILLEEAFEAGFSAGYHCEDNPGSYMEDWKEYLKEELKEYADNIDE